MDSGSRLLGTVLDILETAAATDGHMFLPRDDLCRQVAARLDVTPAVAATAVHDAVIDGHVVVRGTSVYLTRLHEAEANVVKSLTGMLKAAGR